MAEIEKEEVILDETELVETTDPVTTEELTETETDETETPKEDLEEQTPIGSDLVDNDNFIEPEVDTNEFVGDNPDAIRECKGMFIRIPASNFTQNANYCDEYLKSKGLFKED